MIDPTIPLWSFAPDWSNIIRERIEFRTDVIPAEDGSEQTRSTRLTPRRSFEYLLSLLEANRQAAANLAWSNGARQFYLPIWTDGIALSTGAPDPTTMLDTAVPTAGFDFAPGQVAAIMGATPQSYELVEVGGVDASTVELINPTAAVWAPGSILYPVRKAYLDDSFSQAAFTPGMGYGLVRWIVAEANPYPAVDPVASYRDFPVLTTRPAYVSNRDPSLAFERPLDIIDDDIAVRALYDRVGIPLYAQVHEWQLQGRAQLAAFRGLAYALRGKRNSIWIPTWNDDLTVTANLAATGTALSVAWSGYALRIAQAINRRDLRIELTDGTVLYRRITASAEAGGNETLTLDAHLGLGRTVTAAEFAQVSFMGLCRSDSDIFEFGWWTGDYADVSTAWRGRKHDL